MFAQQRTTHTHSHMERIFDYRLRNMDSLENGSAGLVVKDEEGQQFVLTCSHVALGNGEDLGGFVQNSDQRVLLLKNGLTQEKGILHYAQFSEWGDVALIQVQKAYSNVLPDGTPLVETAEVVPLKVGDFIFFYSSQSRAIVSGEIECVQCIETISAGGGISVKFTQIIRFGIREGMDWQTNSAKGDSGSIVFNENFEAIALLIGGNDHYSFALPLAPILERTKTTIKR